MEDITQSAIPISFLGPTPSANHTKWTDRIGRGLETIFVNITLIKTSVIIECENHSFRILLSIVSFISQSEKGRMYPHLFSVCVCKNLVVYRVTTKDQWTPLHTGFELFLIILGKSDKKMPY